MVRRGSAGLRRIPPPDLPAVTVTINSKAQNATYAALAAGGKAGGVVAALILSGAATEPEAVIAMRAVPDLTDASAERLARITRWAFHLYLPGPVRSGPVRIQPDMLAEWFLITQLTSAPGLAGHLDGRAGHDIPALLTLSPTLATTCPRLSRCTPASSRSGRRS